MNKLYMLACMVLIHLGVHAHNAADWKYTLREASLNRSLLVVQGRSHQLIQMLQSSGFDTYGLDVAGADFQELSTLVLEENLRFSLEGQNLPWRLLGQDVGPHEFTLRYILDLSYRDLGRLKISKSTDWEASGHTHHHLRMLFHDFSAVVELKQGSNSFEELLDREEANLFSLHGRSYSPLFIIYCLLLMIFGLIGLLLRRLMRLSL